MPLVVYILGLAIFSLGTAELMVAGMMTTLSEAFGVTVGEVGHLISYYAFGVMLGRVRISTLRNENETFSQLNSITYIGVFLRLVTYSHLP